MLNFLMVIIGALFLALLFLNLYFRVKVFKSYKILVQNRIEFGASHIFSREKMEQEILPKYPQHRAAIVEFVNHLRYSIRMASVLLVLITVFGGVLMYFR